MTRKEIDLPAIDHRLLAAIAGLAAAALYLSTMAPTAQWYDMAEMAAGAYLLGILHHTGYPLYVLLGKLFTYVPIGDIAYRVHLMSAAAAVGTVVVVFFIVWELTRNRGAAFLAALVLATTSTLWANATYAESYDLNALLIALLTWFMLRWQRSEKRGCLWAAFYTIGLGMGNHHLIQFFGPALALYWLLVVLRRGRPLPWRDWLGMALAFLLGFAINIYLPIRAAQDPPFIWADASDPLVFLQMITIGKQQGSTIASPLASWPAFRLRLRTITLFPLYEYTAVGLALALIGAIRLARQEHPLFWHCVVGAALTLLMVLFYSIHNIFQYFLPIYVVLAIGLGVGIDSGIAFIEKLWRERVEPHTKALGAQTVSLILAMALLALPAHLVLRDYAVIDRSEDYSAFDFANYLADRLEPNAVVLADFWAWAPLAYYQHLGDWRPDVAITGALSSHGIDWDTYLPELLEHGGPVYVASGLQMPEALADAVPLQPVALNVIESATVGRLPLPEYKDVWLPLMDLHRIGPPPDLQVTDVPADVALDIQYGPSLHLRGFAGPDQLAVGQGATLSYYWALSSETDQSYYASVRFEDENGYYAFVRNLPVWDHSHYVGSAQPTDGWPVDAIMLEQLDTLVPWRMQPGRYAVRLQVYTDSLRQKVVAPVNVDAPPEGAIIGYIEVLPRATEVAMQTR